jgi:PIN domain nuclease of toxin-antitoxin system
VKFLLDTHTFIWWSTSPDKLSRVAFATCNDDRNELSVSVISIWEIQIKVRSGKLKLSKPIGMLVEHQQTTNDVKILPVMLEHVLVLDSLPDHHRDPFDRLLIAQSIAEEMSLISGDSVLARYAVPIVW